MSTEQGCFSHFGFLRRFCQSEEAVGDEPEGHTVEAMIFLANVWDRDETTDMQHRLRLIQSLERDDIADNKNKLEAYHEAARLLRQRWGFYEQDPSS